MKQMLYSFLNQVSKIKSTNANHVKNNSFQKRNYRRRQTCNGLLHTILQEQYIHTPTDSNTTLIFLSAGGWMWSICLNK